MLSFVFSIKDVKDSINFMCDCGKQISNNNLQSSFFCSSCQSIKCLICVKQNLHSAFCPQCLDVTKITSSLKMSSSNLSSSLYFSQSSLHTLRHRCRKCIYCPICKSSSILIKSRSNESSVYFYCPFCRWNSLDESIKEENITKLYSIPIKLEKEDPSVRIVEDIIKRRKQEQEMNKNKVKDDSIISQKESMIISKNKKNIEVDNIELNEEEFYYTPLSNKLDHYTTYKSQDSKISIQRIPLFGFKTTNCGKCNKDLISYKSVESDIMGSSNNINFDLRESVTLYVPHISLAIPTNITQNNLLQINEWNDLYLRFLNPRHEDIDIHLLLKEESNQEESFILSSKEYKFRLTAYPLPHIYDPADFKPIVFQENDNISHQNGTCYLKLKIKPLNNNTPIIVNFDMIVQWIPEGSNETNILKTTLTIDVRSMYKN